MNWLWSRCDNPGRVKFTIHRCTEGVFCFTLTCAMDVLLVSLSLFLSWRYNAFCKGHRGKLHYRWATWLCSCQTPLCWLCILFDTQVQRSSLSPPVMLWLCVHAEINEWKEHSRLKIPVCKGCLLTHKGESIGLRCHVKIRLVSLLHNSSAIRSLQFPLQSDCATGCGTVGLSKESNSQSQPQCFPLLSADLPRSY